MADLTWIDVVDSAVKIVGAASVAGGFTWVISKSRQDHELEKAKCEQDHELKKAKSEQDRQTLKDLNEKLETAIDHLNDYAHLSRSVTLPSESAQAKENSDLVMSSFKAMTRAKGLAYLIGQNDLCTAFEKTSDSLLEMYYLASEDIPGVEKDNAHEKLAEAAGKIKALNNDMKELRLKVSESYSIISLS